MSSNVVSILTTYVVPSVGSLLTLALFFSPMQGAMRVHKEQDIGDFNIVPYAFMFANCFAWTMYAVGLAMPSTFFVFFPNLLGFVSGAIVLALTFPYASPDTRMKVLAVFLGIICIQAPVAFFVATFADTPMRLQILGYVADGVQLLFFGSPLLGIVEIIRTRDSKTLHWPLALTASTSSALWAIYGFAINNLPIMMPNLISTLIGLVQVALCLIFKNSSASPPHKVSFTADGTPLKSSKYAGLLDGNAGERSMSSKNDETGKKL